jgi:hypothetical protein
MANLNRVKVDRRECGKAATETRSKKLGEAGRHVLIAPSLALTIEDDVDYATPAASSDRI